MGWEWPWLIQSRRLTECSMKEAEFKHDLGQTVGRHTGKWAKAMDYGSSKEGWIIHVGRMVEKGM